MLKSELKIGKKYNHKFRGECVYTEACAEMEKYNPDPTSVFMEFDNWYGSEEVTLNLIWDR